MDKADHAYIIIFLTRPLASTQPNCTVDTASDSPIRDRIRRELPPRKSAISEELAETPRKRERQTAHLHNVMQESF
jgi:hypothetical protein